MNNFIESADEYFQAGYKVVPITHKKGACYVADWQNVDFEYLLENEEYNFIDQNQKEQTLKNKGIGLLCGKKSGVVCVDIDTKDVELQNEIYAQLPPLMCGKIGNKNKGKNYFFKYNGEPNLRMAGLDIISDLGMTVIPNTIHSSGFAYEWVGTELLHVDELPLLPDSFIAWAQNKFAGNKGNSQIEKSDGSRCNHNSHSVISSIAVSMLHNGHTAEEIVHELIKHDKEINETVSYFRCSTRRWKCNDVTANAFMFVGELLVNQAKSGATVHTREPVTEDAKIEFKEKKKRKKFPKLEGIAQEMFEHVYNNSTKKRTRFSLASAISAMSICIGNKIRYDNIHPNVYALIVAESGEGKDTPLKFPKQCLIQADLKHLIGQSQPASDSGIIGPLKDQPKRIDTIDEADILFSSINSKNNASSAKMADVYAMLYTSCGGYFEGKITARSKFKREGECENPYVTIFGAMTPEAFRDSMTTKTINKGLGARFLYFVDENRKRNKLIENYNEKIPQRVIDFFKMWNDTDALSLSNHVPQIKRSPKVDRQLALINKMYEDFKYNVPTTSKMRPIYNRAFEMVVKLATIHAASVSYKTTNIELSVEGIDWANEFMGVYFDNMKEFIEYNVSVSSSDRNANRLLDALSKSGNGLTKSELHKKTQGLQPQERNSILKDLVDMGDVVLVKEKTKTKTASRYVLSKFIVYND